MAKHQKPSGDSEGDGQIDLDEIELARMLKEEQGQHAAEEEDEDE